MTEQIDPKKRYNVILEHPKLGLGEPGQRGFFDVSAEEVKEMVAKGAKIERVSEAAFIHSGYVVKNKAEQNRINKERARRRR